MPGAVRAPSRSRTLRLTLNSDGRRHPLLNSLTAFTFFGGIAAFVCGLIVSAHFFASVIGIAAFGVGLWAQMASATRKERIFIVTGLVAAFVGIGLGIAHGGFG